MGLFGFIGNYLPRRSLSALELQLKTALSPYFHGGDFIFFSSARAALLSFLLSNDVRDGDDVIVTGASCSVVIDVIKISGAKPVYVDIDEDTFGTSTEAIFKAITNSTKVVIVQHSFGLPSNALNIIPELQRRGILVVEDCALSVGSSRSGLAVGSMGDAAIISFGHSKPINGFMGGALFSRDTQAISDVKSKLHITELSASQRALSFGYSLVEHFLCRQKLYYLWHFFLLATGLIQRIFPSWQPFLSTRTPSGGLLKSSDILTTMPKFALILATGSAAQRLSTHESRMSQLAMFRSLIPDHLLPAAYADPDNAIDPFRFVLYAETSRDDLKLGKLLDLNQIWFKQPIEATALDLRAFGYATGDCPVSESLGKKVINVPSHLSDSILRELLGQISS